MGNEIEEIAERRRQLEERMAQLTTTRDSMRYEVEVLKARLAEERVESQVHSLEEEVAALEGQKASLEGEIAAFHAEPSIPAPEGDGGEAS